MLLHQPGRFQLIVSLLTGLLLVHDALLVTPIRKISIVASDEGRGVLLCWTPRRLPVVVKTKPAEWGRVHRAVSSKFNSPDWTAAMTSSVRMAVVVSYSSVDVEWFKSRPKNLGVNGCLIFIARRTQGRRTLFVPVSRRLSIVSESNRFSGRGL